MTILARGAAPADEIQTLPHTGARFQPGGSAGLERLLNGEPPDRAAVTSQVTAQGFYGGDPLGAGECAGCHAEIAAQWAQSAHRFASFNNPYYAAAVELLQRDRPPEVARFCAGCHDPLLLITDAISRPRLQRTTAAAQAGLPCLVCHSIKDGHDRRGNGGYTLALSPVPAASGQQAAAGAQTAHGARLRPAGMASSEVCVPCHKVGLLPELTGDGWFRGQNEYDAWQSSVAAGQGVAAVYRDGAVQRRCQDCHMPLEDGARGQKVRSHRFLAANTALPHLRGDADMEARTATFLRDAVSLDLLVQPLTDRGAKPPQLGERVAVKAGSTVILDVVLRNRRVGHRFPGGTADSNEARVLVEVRPLGSRDPFVVRDERHVLRGQPVDDEARPLRRRDVHNFRGVVYDTSLGPADPQVTRYRLNLATLPSGREGAALGALEVRASLRYRKFSADYAAFACAALPAGPTKDRCLDLPDVEVAAARRVLLVGSGGAASGAEESHPSTPPRPLWERFLDHGLGLVDGVVDQTGEALPSLMEAVALAPARAEPQLGLARLYLAQGRTADVLAACARAEALRPDHPASLWLRALALYRSYRWSEARPSLERLMGLLPNDRNVLTLLARVRGLTEDSPGALLAADTLLRIDTESEDGHYQRMLALREMGQLEEAAMAESRYLTFRRKVEQEQRLRDRFRTRYPSLADEDAPAHFHELTLRR